MDVMRRLATFLPVALWLAAGMCVGATVPVRPVAAQVIDAAQAQRPPWRVPILVSSRNDQCFDAGDIAAITTMVRTEVDRINRSGGVAGRFVEAPLLDDVRDAQRTTANLKQALDDPQTLAVIGLAGTDRAKPALEALGKDIREKAVPILTRLTVNSLFKDLPSVYTTQATQDDERLPVMAAFMKRAGFERPAFVGAADAVFSKALGDGLRRALIPIVPVADHRLPAVRTHAEDNAPNTPRPFDPAAIAAMIGELKEKSPDILVLGVGGARAAGVMDALVKADVAPALFLAGRLETLPADLVQRYPNAIYQLAWDRLPEAENDRLRRMVDKQGPASRWVFEGKVVPEAPGWASGACKSRDMAAEPEPFSAANLRAITIGSEHADMLALIATAAKSAPSGTDLAGLRRQILSELSTSYAGGRGAFKGQYENWSFNPGSRAAERTPFVVILPRGLGRTQLAPIQFVRVRDGTLRAIETLYADIDLIRAHHIDDNEKTFFAEFYLSMRNGATSTVEQIEFTNAFLDPKTNGRQLTIETLHDGGPSNAYPPDMRVYKVAGRFVYEPDLSKYPFDTQRFSIDLQPRRGDTPFIVQPPPQLLRDKTMQTDGWDQLTQYVSYDEDFVPLLDAYTHKPSIVPFYKASFVWMMQRQTTDYYLRVVVPLAFILAVAYLSIFIPISHFEAIVTIQVTALLSAVALYLSLPKLDSDTATVSDKIFVFNYMMVSLMIVISILRMNGVVTPRRWIGASLWTLHVVAVPVAVAAVAWFVWQLGTKAML